MKKFFVLAAALMLGLCLPAHAQEKSLTAAGATFPYPFYSKTFDVYHQTHGIKVNYQAIGSGGGILQLKNKTVDFGASDAFLSDEQMASMGAPVVHVPTVLGAVVLTYNLPGKPALKLTPGVLSDIYLGKITKWNDPRIAAINPGVRFPDLNMAVVHRSDGSGTTFIFSGYLAKVSSEWKEKVGYGTSLNWPVGLGGKGNPGVAGLVKEIPGSIGYVELIYSLQNNMPCASLQNSSGNFIRPTLKSTSISANVALPEDMRVSLTNTEAKEGYPITGFTYLIEYREMHFGKMTFEKAKEVVNLMWWIVHGAQKYAEPLYYSPLPPAAVKRADALIRSFTFDGRRVLQ